MYRIFKYKKGVTEDLVPLVVTIFIFGGIILIFNINDINKKSEMYIDIKTKVGNIEAEQELLNFLEKEVEVNGKTTTIADLINSYYYAKSSKDKNKNKNILEKEIETMLDSLPKPIMNSNWNILIYRDPGPVKLIEISFDRPGWYNKEPIFAYMPLPNNPEQYIIFKLWLECRC